MSRLDKILKRCIDIVFSFVSLLFLGWFIILIALFSKFIIGGSGFFSQIRIGRGAQKFKLYKIETISPKETIKQFPNISRFGIFLRSTKLDELPQLFNILIGDMSFVGPRPDVSGFADKLVGPSRVILTVKPGLTGPATIKYWNEEKILKGHENCQEYYKKVIWPDKVRINTRYVLEYNRYKDFFYILKTIFVVVWRK